MKVLQINAVNGIRSTGRTVKELDEYLQKNGHTSIVVYSDGDIPENGYKMGSIIDRKVHALLSRITGLQGYFSKRSTKKLLGFLDETQPEIVHIRNLHSNFINMPMLFEYLSNYNIPTVVTLHDCWFFTGGHTHFTADEYYDWKNGFNNAKKNKSYLGNKSWFFDTSEKIYRDQIKWFNDIPKLAFVGVSKWVTKEAMKSKVTNSSMVETIYNWIDTDIFKPTEINSLKRKLNLDGKFIILGVASSWSDRKGLHKFIELSKIINDNIRIILIGSLDEGIELPSDIIHVSETDNVQELVQYYSLADVFLNLSIEETFGKVSAEALACGTPVITVDSTANAEIIGPGCGYILDEWDTALAIKKIKLVKKKGKKIFSDECRSFVKEKFNSQKNMRKYIDLYETLIS